LREDSGEFQEKHGNQKHFVSLSRLSLQAGSSGLLCYVRKHRARFDGVSSVARFAQSNTLAEHRLENYGEGNSLVQHRLIA
jgi:hypothetical protein